MKLDSCCRFVESKLHTKSKFNKVYLYTPFIALQPKHNEQST
jgi:hypothetical protein